MNRMRTCWRHAVTLSSFVWIGLALASFMSPAPAAAAESRSLTNMFEVMVREHAKKLHLAPTPVPAAPTKKTKPTKN